MVKCTYCGHEEQIFRGIHLITNDGVVQYFCSSKCRKNSLKLKRDKRKLKWTEAYRIALNKIRVKEAARETQQEPQAVKITEDKTKKSAKRAKKTN